MDVGSGVPIPQAIFTIWLIMGPELHSRKTEDIASDVLTALKFLDW